MKRTSSLYIHVPFCHAKCAYCDFYSKKLNGNEEQSYLQNLEKEFRARRYEVGNFDTIYFGGGTPSILGTDGIFALRDWLPVYEGDNKGNKVSEFTVEFNPEDVNQDKINAWREIGADRVSMGVQSLNPEELNAVGRRHTAEQAIQSLEVLRGNFSKVSVDIIIGLPGQTQLTLLQTLKQLLEYRPEHLSVYILSYEPGTRLWARLTAGKITETSDEDIAARYMMVCEMMRQEGYLHYEISNFALPGFEAVHNSSYWKGIPYLGLGPAAHSFDGKVRRVNPTDIRKWSTLVEKKGMAYTVENETEVEAVNNRIMVSLRTASGLDMNSIPEPYQAQILANAGRLPAGRIERHDNRIIIPEKGWLLSDNTIATLFVE